MENLPFSKKQIEFITRSTKKWNLAHGSVRTGKTICTLFRFLQAVYECPDSQIYMVGHSSDTIYQNAIRLILESPQFDIYRPFCSWFAGKRQLKFMDKTIQTLGAKDEGAIGAFQGKTFSLVYCDEMTLYPTSIIDMIDTRLSNPHSMGFASMNPSHPDHVLKKWIDKAEQGNPSYYALHFTLEDNPYVPEDYKQRIRESLTGLFYKRNYLGLWCLAEGAIFDFFDEDVHVVDSPPLAADYWIAGIDYGTANPFACLLVGVNTGRHTGLGPRMWVEKEYYWDSKVQGRQKINSEFADDVEEFLEPYGVKQIFIDPSAQAFQLEMQRRGYPMIHANNDVETGIQRMTQAVKRGTLVICRECKNTIREMQGYVWDPKCAKMGIDKPLKENDHCFVAGTLIDCLDGNKPIETVLVGDYVFTRYGFKKVIRTGNNVKAVETYDIWGTKVICTPDHRFFTENGWKEAKTLIHSDILYRSNLCLGESAKSLNMMDTNIDGIQTLHCLLKESTIQETGAISIEPYGKSITEKYHPDVIYITSTKTPITMMFPICNLLQESSISRCIKTILEKTDLRVRQDWPPQSGIVHPKEKNGIESTLKNVNLENIKEKPSSVNVVTSSLKESKEKDVLAHDFVRIIVKVNTGDSLVLITRLEYVPFASSSLSATNIQPQGFVQKNVEETSGNNVVYNLEIEEIPEFFANGYLVHNSIDALRYVLNTHQVSTYDPSVEHQQALNFQRNRYGYVPY